MECTPASLGPVAPPIGKPIANVTLYILDEAWNPVADGESGELYIGGATLARGYLNRPELTAARFIANPFGEGRLYKTGDLVRRLPDGNLDFLGRIDHQVKIRGVRVELGEIEAQLISHPQVQQAVAKVHVTAEHQQQLVAYVVMAKDVNKDIDRAIGDELDDEAAVATALRAQLRTFLQQKLPASMIPAAFVLLDALPLMPSSKIDRAALPSPVPADFVTATFVPPQTPTEALLVTIWQELLGIPQVGRNDDFFAGGGHSLLAMQALARIRAHFGVELLIRTFFAAPTPAMLGAHLDRAEPQAIAALPKLEPVERRPSPMPLSYAQERLWFLARGISICPWSICVDNYRATI